MSGGLEEAVVSPSLLRDIDWKKPVPIRFSLGMSEFVEDGAFLTGKLKENKPVSLKKKSSKRPWFVLKPIPTPVFEVKADAQSSSSRFSIQTKEKYEKMSTPFVPGNTKKNNDWAYSNFSAWRECHNTFPEDPCPTDLIESPPWDTDAMAQYLAKYACETRNVSGGKYPATTIFSLLSGLLRRSRSIDPDFPNFLDTKDPRFRSMHCVIDIFESSEKASNAPLPRLRAAAAT